MSSDNVIELTDAAFEQEILNSEIPALIDFWAEWCPPCKMLTPVIEELAGEFQGRVKFAKVDIDAQREVAAKFGISSIPTLLVFKDGQLAAKFIGRQSKVELKKALEEIL